MKVERFSTQTCTSCGQIALVFKLSSILSKDFLPLFVANGFSEVKHFTKSGILYIESLKLMVQGPFGSDKVTVKCKTNVDCEKYINDFETLLNNIN